MSYDQKSRFILFGAIAFVSSAMALNILSAVTDWYLHHSAWKVANDCCLASLQLTAIYCMVWKYRKNVRRDRERAQELQQQMENRRRQLQVEIGEIGQILDAAALDAVMPVMVGHGEAVLPGEGILNAADPAGIRQECPSRLAVEKAMAHLVRIASVLKAERIGIQCYALRTKGYTFEVDPSYIVDKSTGERTCYQVNSAMPSPEKVATAMLLLNRDPGLFHELCRRNGEWIS